jgi:putative transposase
MSQVISFEPGSVLKVGLLECVVLDLINLESVLVRYVESGEIATVRIFDLACTGESSKHRSPRAKRLVEEVLPLISDKRWRQARQRLMALRPLLELDPYGRGPSRVEEVAKSLGKSSSTVYRWLADFDRSHSMRVFLRLPRSDKGIKKVMPKVDRLIRAVIKKEYLSDQRKMLSTVVEAVQIRCRRKQWSEPHRSTIVRRIQDLQPKTVVEAREGRKAARGRHELARGSHPKVLHPLDEVQMDHTPSDYCIVDDVYRMPIDGAQTLTVCLDINTRCVLGFTLTLEAPSVRVAGACMAHAILPKERFLHDIGVDAYWPCYGMPKVIYTDNASEFEAKAFHMACEMNGIEVRKRPKGFPNFAGHVESLFRTFLQKVHELEGARFANLQKRMEYDTTGKAVMTISDFRKWFTIFITKYYHQKPHSGLAELPPIKAWERAILGSDDRPGIGLPDRVRDEFKLRIDFLPSVERTIQDYGIGFERHKYSDSVLRRWVGSRDPLSPDKARKFIVKYDPHDLTEVYFLDPDLGQYFVIPSVDEMEHVTLWESKAVYKKVRKENLGQVNHDLISEGLDEMREVVEASAKSTRQARRQNQRGIDSKRLSLPKQRKDAEELKKGMSAPTQEPELDDDDVVQPLPGAVLAKPASREQPGE